MKRKTGSALVVGAGIAGIRSALDLAETGYGVTLIDRADHPGGLLAQLDHQFPSDACGMCKMLPLFEKESASQYCLRKGLFHDNLEIRLGTELTALEGEPGRFQATLRSRPALIDPVRCLGCGDCAQVCPVEVPDAFNEGMTKRKAVYLPIPHAIPNPYIIDQEACTLCGECVKACPVQAINLHDEGRAAFRLLVVDDELIVRDSLKEWLQDAGFTVDMAGSGEEALARLAQTPFDVMLLDIKMPGMDGVEVLRRAKEAHPDLTVIMITAYATVDTAVEAMKIGAQDYLIKPFDPEKLAPMVEKVYQDLKGPGREVREFGAVVLACGTGFADPHEVGARYLYGSHPNVVTSLEFERLISGAGPTGGLLLRPSDQTPPRRIAWLQCVGSRDMQSEADFCSSICCMFAMKEARLAVEKLGPDLETAIFYMDMRSFGQSFQRYRDRTEAEGVGFRRARIHTVAPDPESGGLRLSYADQSGCLKNEIFDLVVLSVGARPASGTSDLAEMLGLEVNAWGFPQPRGLTPAVSSREGIFLSGSFPGLKDIGDSVIQAGAAAQKASLTIHNAGGGLALEKPEASGPRDVSQEIPRTLVALCRCGGRSVPSLDWEREAVALAGDPAVAETIIIDELCTAAGWESLAKQAEKDRPNRVLIGACLPYVYARSLKELGIRLALDPILLDAVDLHTSLRGVTDTGTASNLVRSLLGMTLARLKRADTRRLPTAPVTRKALVVGGGIAGLTAALAVADHGYPVEVVETAKALGGNLRWLTRTLEGDSLRDFLGKTVARVEKHPLITVHMPARIISSAGRAGSFRTVIRNGEEKPRTIEHGATILAVGGGEAPVESYGRGQIPAVITQKEFEERTGSGDIDPAALRNVVMIQCAGTREEPRNYCSRVCCPTALRQALAIKEKNPAASVWILYRDIMTTGFAETYYTQARRAGVIFINYETSGKPRVEPLSGHALVTLREPLLQRDVQIEADLVVLAAGVVPALDRRLAQAFGAELDEDGFFEEAESKWRPVDSLKEGVFACGLAHSPRPVVETVAMAEAAAQRALRILCRETLRVDRVVARVRQALCSRCERCLDACAYGARHIDPENGSVMVDEIMCQGCGACAAVCPNSAAVLTGFEDQGMLETIETALNTALGY